MLIKHPKVTFTYYFLSEAIILFLLAIPVFHFFYQWIPYWSYLAIVGAAGLIFSLFTKVTANYSWYFLFIPFLFVLFYMAGFPMEAGLVFTLLLTWRYIKIRGADDRGTENNYLFYTILLGALMSLLIQDTEIFLLVIAQALLLLTGYYISLFAVMEKQERKKANSAMWLGAAGIFAAASAIFLYFFEEGRYLITIIWQGFAQLLGMVLGGLFSLLPFDQLKGLNGTDGTMELEEGAPPPDQDQMAQQVNTLNESSPPYVAIVIAAILLGIIVFLIIRKFKQTFDQVDKKQDTETPHVDLDKENGKKPSLAGRLMKNWRKKPDHPVRRSIMELEQQAARQNKGRHPFETLEDWIKRIPLELDSEVYQKVRYGDEDVSDQEVRELEVQVRRVRDELASRRGER
ncbi:hypothetical protein [Lentibacillus sediminis]|uniref:hypothetical protein n=1 Tax=Lentibacillus sediminis TaxID=1940529 RepID=UPI000C1C7DCC|nr:hypothetical protein [Lentibacillus sediminis]